MQYINDNVVFLKNSFDAAAIFIEKLLIYFKTLDRNVDNELLKELTRLYDSLDIEYYLLEGPVAVRV